LQFALLINATGLYTVVGPGTIRSNSTYNVVVSVHKADGPSQIKVSLNGPSYNETKQIELPPMSTENVEFEVPKLATGDYNLTAEGISGVIFQNSTKLNYADEKPSTFIQTDKATYKPADLVQFRILFLDENTRPAKIDKPISVVITDGAQNRIKQISDVKLTKGVYSGELQLSEQPVLGTWKISVSVDGDSRETKSFDVDKYVLPKFEVIVDTAKDVVQADNVIKATIRAKYTYGKPVKGKATVSMEQSYGYFLDADGNRKQEKTVDIDGKGHVEFDLRGFVQGRFSPPMKLFAIVTEELTGNKQNASATVRLHQQRYTIENLEKPDHFHSNKSFIYQVVVKNVDGSPVTGSAKKVKLSFDNRHYYYLEHTSASGIDFEAPVNENGIATINVKLPENDSSFYRVVATFDGSQSALGTISKFVASTDNGEPLKIEVNTKTPRLGERVSFDVKSIEDIPYFVYTIVARGNILLSEYVDVPDGLKTYTVKFTPTFSMVPKATIYIHYVLNNDLHFEEKSIEFEKEFSNSIVISAPVDAKPSEEVKLRVKTDADSFVGLLGVHQSVLLLKSGNDLNRDDIFNSLNKYQTSTPWQRGYGRYPGQTSGLVTLTNANYPYSTGRKYEYDYDELVDVRVESEVAYDEVDSISSSLPTKIEVIRTNFAEVWIWQTPGNGRLVLMAPIYTKWRLPDADCVFPWGTCASCVGRNLLGAVPIMMVSAGRRGSTKLRKTTKQPIDLTTQPSSVAEKIENIGVRSTFLETWIYELKDFPTDVDGEGFTLSKKIPDTITSWVVTGFSLNPTTGIALTKNPSKIRVFQPFFVSTNLPYSVKRGEVISIPVVIFNYLDKALDTDVVMDNSDQEYEFTEATNEVLEKAIDEVRRVKRVTIPANSGKSVSFMIRPKNVGSTTLKITATSALAGDTIHQKLKVEPEGVTQFENRAVFINLKDQLEMTQSLEAEIPSEVVPQSEFIEFSVVGDLLGPTLQNLDNLVRMPYGCGEQNMVNFVPNILVLKYLEVTGRKLPAVESKAKKFLEIGYQRELTYKHDDGSYSAFGKSDSSGSTWLTAYVMRSFHQAGTYTDVDPKVVSAGLDFLVSKQKESGEFPEVGKLFDNANHNALGLTSFVLLAFFENHELIPKYQSAIQKAVSYVAEEVDKTDDQYSLAIAAVALQLAKHPQAEKVLGKLESLARNENDRKWWSKAPESTGGEGQFFHWKPRSNDVEITSYVLLALLERDPAEQALPIVKWLISQRNSNGGFSSTQDTVHKDSNMAVMEIALPSGFVGDTESLAKIEAVDRVKRVETKNSDSTVIVYFDSLTPGDVRCLPVEASKAHAVAKQKPASVSLYDYYDTDRKATEYYQVQSSLCDICEGADCGDGCKKA
uniref:CD109 antigen n=1 Tax=Drosophila rhopaloa TaxID=1041015 RepID=A0A6P4EZC7_DRORH